ncbi:MAG: YaiO family outer membrane beta-barrel protein [Gallionella sp.]|nr:YaiO family outer membrane beta-barrel protein [Gallionella sp.]
MTAKIFILSILLAMPVDVYAAEAEIPPVPPPVIDIELPAIFTDTQPIPLPPVVAKPAESNQPPAEILPYQMEVGSSYSKLSNGFADWSSYYVNAEMKLAGRNNIYGSMRQENRHSKNDTELMGGFYEPIDSNFTAVIEGSMSPEHHFLPSRTFLGEVEYSGPSGWAGEVGMRHVEYNLAELNVLLLNAERSWSNYRVAYTRFQGFLLGRGSTNSSQVQAAKYYGDHNWYGITVSNGTELETLPDSQVLSSHVRAIVFSGLHWLKPRFGLAYAIGNYHQGNFYIRNGIQLGLRQQF